MDETAEVGTNADPGTPPKAPGMFSPLRHRSFALLWTGQAISSLGNQMFPIILAVLILQRHSGAAGLGLVLAIQGIALAVGTVFAAVVGDRWSRVRMMIATDVVRVVGVLLIAISPIGIPSPLLIVLVAVIGIAEGMFLPAYSAVVPRLLPEDRLQQGNSINATSFYVAMVAGPVVAGGLLAVSGPRLALWVDVITFGASLLTLVFVREPVVEQVLEAEAEAEVATSGFARWLRTGRQDFVEGLRTVAARPWIAASIGMATVVMTFAVAPAFLVAPIEAVNRLGGPEAYGAAFTALGVGSIVGSVIGGRIRTQRPGLVAILGVFTIFGSVISLALLPLAGVLLLWGVAGVGVTIFQIMWTTALQKDVPENLLGRVLALDQLGSQGLMPLGYAVAGVLVPQIGTHTLMIVCACIVVVAAPLPLFVRGGTTFSSRAVPSAPVPSEA